MEGTESELLAVETNVCARAAGGRDVGDGGVEDDGIVGDLDLGGAGGDPGACGRRESPEALPLDDGEDMTLAATTESGRSMTQESFPRQHIVIYTRKLGQDTPFQPSTSNTGLDVGRREMEVKTDFTGGMPAGEERVRRLE